MKRHPLFVVTANPCISEIWFSAIFSHGILDNHFRPRPPPRSNKRGGIEPRGTMGRRAGDGGEAANLNQQFPADKDRKLSAHFLEALLTGTLPGVKLHRNGVRIIGAIIDEPIELSNVKIPWEVWLDDCQFSSAAIFARANFAGIVSFRGSTFKAEANFNGLKVVQFAVFNRVVFEGPVNFGGQTSRISKQLGRSLRTREQSANLQTEDKSGGRCILSKGCIRRDGRFSFGRHRRQFRSAAGAVQQQGPGRLLLRHESRAIVSFKDAVFEGRVEFDAADIGANFEADEAQFRNKAETIRLVMKCGRQGVFKAVAFAGPVSFKDSSFLDLVIGDTETRRAADLRTRSVAKLD